MAEAQNGLAFNHDLSLELNVVGQTPNVRDLRVDDIIDVHVVEPEEANGKWFLDRTTVNEAERGTAHMDVFRSPGQIPKHTDVGDPDTYDYLLREIAPYSKRVYKKALQRSHVPISQRRRAAIITRAQLAEVLFDYVVGIYSAANFPDRNDTAAAIAPDGKTIDDATHAPVEFWLAAAELAENGNAEKTPDRLVLPYAYMRKLQTHAGFLASMSHHDHRDAVPMAKLKDHLEARLNMEIVVKRKRWPNKAMFIYRGGETVERQIPGASDGEILTTRTNGASLGFDEDGNMGLTSVTAALILEKLQGGQLYNTSGDPLTWGVYEDIQSYWTDVRCAMSGQAIPVDPKSGYLVTGLFA